MQGTMNPNLGLADQFFDRLGHKVKMPTVYFLAVILWYDQTAVVIMYIDGVETKGNQLICAPLCVEVTLMKVLFKQSNWFQ